MLRKGLRKSWAERRRNCWTVCHKKQGFGLVFPRHTETTPEGTFMGPNH